MQVGPTSLQVLIHCLPEPPGTPSPVSCCPRRPHPLPALSSSSPLPCCLPRRQLVDRSLLSSSTSQQRHQQQTNRLLSLHLSIKESCLEILPRSISSYIRKLFTALPQVLRSIDLLIKCTLSCDYISLSTYRRLPGDG